MISILASWLPSHDPNYDLDCWHEGTYTEHRSGSSMPCMSGQCNHCHCNNGSISSTYMGCHEDSCFKDGIEYKHGSTVPKADGCNNCGCSNGKISWCTKLPCPPLLVIT